MSGAEGYIISNHAHMFAGSCNFMICNNIIKIFSHE